MSIQSTILTFLYRQFVRNRSAGLSVEEILVKVNKVADRERRVPPNIQLTGCVSLAPGNRRAAREDGRCR